MLCCACMGTIEALVAILMGGGGVAGVLAGLRSRWKR